MNSIISNERKCYVCGTTQCLEKHHVYIGNPNRKNSEEDGLWVYLCHEHHTGNTGVHFQKELMQMLHEIGQKKYELTHTREQFRSRYGRSWL